MLITCTGAGDSGKSTFFKQVRHIYGDDSVDENVEETKHSFRGAIYYNVLETMQALCKSYFQHNNRNPDKQLTMSEDNIEKATQFVKLELSIVSSESVFTPELLQTIQSLWSEEAIQTQFKRRFELHVFDGAVHFFTAKNLERLDPRFYTPSFEDALYCRRKTTGVVEAVAKTPYCTFHFIDVGGMYTLGNTNQ